MSDRRNTATDEEENFREGENYKFYGEMLDEHSYDRQMINELF
jgi:hypothetical protein